ncbi:MAG TPA: response regulator [Caulobacteraceae bacterium]|nr:response regulator [Caulobacteraceae bacterium]
MSEQLRSPERQQIAARRAVDPTRSPDRSHVLIVDDHALSRRLYAGYCDLFDHTSEVVAGGAEALEALRRERFHVVVMNVHMAEAGGVDTLRAIRALPAPAGETPVIGLTAVGRHHEAQRWLGAGLADVLAKPITAAKLYAALNTAVETGRDDPARSWAPTN